MEKGSIIGIEEASAMLSEAQQKNYNFFTENLQSYLENSLLRDKYGVFFGEELKGVYDSFEAAFSTACSQYPIGEFIVQQLADPSETVEFLATAVI